MAMEEPTVIKGGLAKDDRGAVSFVNDFVMFDVKRFYVIEAAHPGCVRAWIGHRFERKWFFAVSGRMALVVRTLESFDPEVGSPDSRVFYLDACEPQVVALPCGFAIGIKALSENARMLVYSDKTLEEAKDDVIRFDKNHGFEWDGV